MAEYFTESQYNILADWSDKKLAMLAGTNDAIDAEIKRRAVEKEETPEPDKGGITEIPIDEKGEETWGEWFKGLFSEADVPSEELMQLAKGVTFRNPLEEERMSREGKYRITDRIGEGGIPSGDYTRDEYDLQLRLLTLDPAVQDFFQYYVDQGHDPEKVMNILQRKYTDEDRKKEVQRYHGVIIHRPETQTSSAQYLINQARKGAFDTDTLGVQVASAGNLRGSGIPGIIERKWQAEKKLREDLGRDTSSQVPTYVDTAQVAAEPTGGGWQPDYSGAVAHQQQEAAEAGQTHEQFMSDLDAVMAKGGLVSVNHLTRRL